MADCAWIIIILVYTCYPKTHLRACIKLLNIEATNTEALFKYADIMVILSIRVYSLLYYAIELI